MKKNGIFAFHFVKKNRMSLITCIKKKKTNKKTVWRMYMKRKPDDITRNPILFLDAAKKNETWEELGKVDNSDIAIPLLMQNKVPEGFETDEKLDVSLRPSEVRVTLSCNIYR